MQEVCQKCTAEIRALIDLLIYMFLSGLVFKEILYLQGLSLQQLKANVEVFWIRSVLPL